MNYYNLQNLNNYDSNILFTPYEGFLKGNMFKSLYSPYRNYDAYQIQPMNDQAKLLTDIDSLGFSLIDLNLYLDVYPDDESYINLYNQYKNQRNQLINNYENKYGPLTLNSDFLNTYPWIWNNRPWPWDN